jgi:hypothetical protein
MSKIPRWSRKICVPRAFFQRAEMILEAPFSCIFPGSLRLSERYKIQQFGGRGTPLALGCGRILSRSRDGWDEGGYQVFKAGRAIRYDGDNDIKRWWQGRNACLWQHRYKYLENVTRDPLHKSQRAAAENGDGQGHKGSKLRSMAQASFTHMDPPAPSWSYIRCA